MNNGQATATYLGVVVTPSNTPMSNQFSAFMATGAGNITFSPRGGGANILLTAVPIYTVIPIATDAILATGTTSTGIIGLN